MWTDVAILILVLNYKWLHFQTMVLKLTVTLSSNSCVSTDNIDVLVCEKLGSENFDMATFACHPALLNIPDPPLRH